MILPALVDVTCKQVVELVGDYLGDRALGANERTRLEQHFFACSWCMDYLHQLQGAQQAMRSLAAEPSEATTNQLLALFRRQHTEPAEPVAPPAPPEPGTRFAFKFLMTGCVAPISHFRWPRPTAGAPGSWVEVLGRLDPCRRGLHASSLRTLSSWLHDELWLVELSGSVRNTDASVVAARGRLVREVEAWRLGGAARFARAAHDHAHEQVEAAVEPGREAARPCVAACAAHLPHDNIALAAFCAAMSLARLRGVDHFDQASYDAERRWQSAWIRQELGLDALLASHGVSDPP